MSDYIEIGVGKVNVVRAHDVDDPKEARRIVTIFEGTGVPLGELAYGVPLGELAYGGPPRPADEVGRVLCHLRIADADGAQVFMRFLQDAIDAAREADAEVKS